MLRHANAPHAVPIDPHVHTHTSQVDQTENGVKCTASWNRCSSACINTICRQSCWEGRKINPEPQLLLNWCQWHRIDFAQLIKNITVTNSTFYWLMIISLTAHIHSYWLRWLYKSVYLFIKTEIPQQLMYGLTWTLFKQTDNISTPTGWIGRGFYADMLGLSLRCWWSPNLLFSTCMTIRLPFFF